jgi:hypothetical protein
MPSPLSVLSHTFHTSHIHQTGPTFSDATLLLAQVGNGSSIVSVPGYSTAVNATNHNGEDAIRINKDQDLGTWDFRAGFV